MNGIPHIAADRRRRIIMNDNNSIGAAQKFPMMPVAPLGVIAMRGCGRELY